MRGIPWCTLVWGARYTLGARYLSKNTVIFFLCVGFTSSAIFHKRDCVL